MTLAKIKIKTSKESNLGLYIYQNSLVRLCIEVKWKRDLIYKIIYNKIYNFIIKTNQGNKGLISADRRTKPTLMLTIPRSY